MDNVVDGEVEYFVLEQVVHLKHVLFKLTVEPLVFVGLSTQ